MDNAKISKCGTGNGYRLPRFFVYIGRTRKCYFQLGVLNIKFRKMVEQNNGIDDFQKFSDFAGAKKLRISNKLRIVSDLSGKSRTVFYKYFNTENLLKSLAENSLYLASPSQWDDPFETKYMESLGTIAPQDEKDTSTLKEYSVFATCFKGESEIVNEEAAWKIYMSGSESIVRVEIDAYNLCYGLCNSIFDEGKLYFSKMVYQSRNDIVTPAGIPVPGEPDSEEKLQDLFINNFSLKRNAYNYEEEVRVSLIRKDGKDIDHMILSNFNWDDVINKITLQPLNPFQPQYEEKLLRNISTYQKIKYVNSKMKIYKSNLYDSNEENEETEINL